MAFIANTVSLQRGFEQLQSIAQAQKTYLQSWSAKLTGNITALDAMEWVSNLNRALAAMDAVASLPGMQAYAQQQFGNAAYDVATEYTNMRSAQAAVLSWLKTNIPSNAITISNGVAVGAIYAPAATAPLKTLVDAAVATIA